MKLTIQSKRNAQTVVDLFNAIVTGQCSAAEGLQPLSIYDEDRHICSIVDGEGGQVLELIIEREDGDVICPAFEGNPDEEKLS